MMRLCLPHEPGDEACISERGIGGALVTAHGRSGSLTPAQSWPVFKLRGQQSISGTVDSDTVSHEYRHKSSGGILSDFAPDHPTLLSFRRNAAAITALQLSRPNGDPPKYSREFLVTVSQDAIPGDGG